MVRRLHLGLRQKGIDSQLIGFTKHDDSEEIASVCMNFTSPYNLSIIFNLWQYIRRNVKSGDILHFHLFPTNFYGAILKLFMFPAIHIVTTEHSTSNRRRATYWGRWIDLFTYQRYRNIIAISEGTKKALIKWQPSITNKIITINNGASLAFNKLLSRSGINTLKILSVGSLRDAKNYEKALEGFSLIQDLDVEYYIAGKGPLEAILKQQTKALGIADRIHWLGHISDTKKVYEEADIFLMPSKWEGFGLAAIEAMNAALPCVISNIPGLGDIFNEREDGLLIDPEDATQIASALRTLVGSKKLRESLGKAAFQKSFEFSEEHMVEKYYEFYCEFKDE